MAQPKINYYSKLKALEALDNDGALNISSSNKNNITLENHKYGEILDSDRTNIHRYFEKFITSKKIDFNESYVTAGGTKTSASGVNILNNKISMSSNNLGGATRVKNNTISVYDQKFKGLNLYNTKNTSYSPGKIYNSKDQSYARMPSIKN